MKLEPIHKPWKFLPAGEKNIRQFVYMDKGQRSRFTENPENPLSELSRFIENNKSFTLLVVPPCSLETIKYASENFEHLLVVDYDKERLDKFNEVSSFSYKTVLAENEDELRDSLSSYVNELSYGNAVSYLPSRYSKLDHRLRCLLKEDLLKIQQEFCSYAANRSLKSWHRALNAVENIKNIKKSVLSLPNINGMDCLIVGAGPSLDDTVLKILKHKSFFYIIATDGSLKTLLRNNIVPDFIVSCEDTVMSWQFFSGYLENLKDVPLVIPYTANHYLLKNYIGPVCLTKCRGREKWTRGIVEGLLEINTGRCVGHFAYNLAIALGAGRIIMTGFDLAFKGDVFHPKDMAVPYFHEMDLPVPVTVKSVEGNELRTDLSMKTYLKDFEYMIKNSNVSVIDATEGGALINGTKILGLDELTYSRAKPQLKIMSQDISLSQLFLEKRMSDIEFFEQLALCFTSYLVQNSRNINENEKSADRNMAYSILESLLLVKEGAGEEAVEAFLLPEVYAKNAPWFIWALENGLKLIEQDSLSSLLQKIKIAGVDHLYCVNGEVAPDLLALTDIKCTDLKTSSIKNNKERVLWLKNYSILSAPEFVDYWQATVPGQIVVRPHEAVRDIEKVGNGN